MGSCVNKKQRIIENKKYSEGCEQNEFKIVFSNIKIKNLPFKDSLVQFHIDKSQIIKTPPISNNNNPHWKSSFQSTYKNKMSLLNQCFYKISVISIERKKVFSTVTLNMLDVATGPVHYDLFLDSTKSKSRICFDLRMAQKVQLRIVAKLIYCDLKNQLQEQAYHFQLKVRSHNIDYQSELSPNYLNPYLQRQSQSSSLQISQSSCKNFGYIYMEPKEKIRSESDEFQLIYNNFNFEESMNENIEVDMESFKFKKQFRMNTQPKLIKKSSSNNQLSALLPQKQKTTIKKPKTRMDLVLKRDINWEFRTHEDSPQVQFDIYVDEFVSSSFEFVLWGTNNIKNEKTIELRLIGNSIISMNKFCSWNVNVNVLAELTIYTLQEVKFKNELWNQGQSVGKTKGEFLVYSNPYLKQMLGRFQTEEGIQRSSLLYIKKDKYAGVENQQIQFIIEMNIQLDDLVSQLNQKQLSHKNKVRISDEICEKIHQLIKLVGKQELYRNQDEMIKAQQIFIDLAKNLLENADLVDEDLREPYYELLTMLLNRDEFYITHIGFEEFQLEVYNNRNDQSYVKSNKKEINNMNSKIRIALHYQNFLHQTLEKAVAKITSHVQNQKEQSFVDSFFVIAFFRIPRFQSIILDILKQDQRTLNEPFENDLLKEEAFDTTFSAEWGKNFYHYIKEEQRYLEHMNQLELIIQQVDWKHLILKSGTFVEWLKLMLQHYKKAKLPYEMNVSWTGFPGYLLLVRHLLLEIKYNQEYPYSDSLKEASNSILENENVLTSLVIVIFHKTKLYDGIAVYYTLDMVSMWFEELRKSNRKVPADFNYQFLMKGLYLILDGQHALSITKAISLIDLIYLQLPIEIQKEICDHLLDKCFFKFFMFWSKMVRYVFQHFLIYRIQHRLKNYRQESIRDIYKEFECIKLQQEVVILEEKSKLLNHLIYIKYSQLIELVVKMKKVIGKHQQQNENILQMQLEAKSMKLKLMKKRKQQKMHTPNKKNEQLSDEQLQSFDVTFEQYKRPNISLTFSQQDAMFNSDKYTEQEIEIQQQNSYQQNGDNEDLYQDHSFGSLINLDEILQEIEEDKKKRLQTNKKKVLNNRKQSYDIGSQMSQEKEQDKNKVTIFHRFQDKPQWDIHKELLQYLLLAMQEWQESQANYKRWFTNVQNDAKKKNIPSNLRQQYIIDYDPPEMILYVPKDETENDQGTI